MEKVVAALNTYWKELVVKNDQNRQKQRAEKIQKKNHLDFVFTAFVLIWWNSYMCEVKKITKKKLTEQQQQQFQKKTVLNWKQSCRKS